MSCGIGVHSMVIPMVCHILHGARTASMLLPVGLMNVQSSGYGM